MVALNPDLAQLDRSPDYGSGNRGSGLSTPPQTAEPGPRECHSRGLPTAFKCSGAPNIRDRQNRITDSNLKPGPRAVARRIAEVAHPTFYGSVDELARFTGYNPRTVQRYLRHLEGMGFLQRAGFRVIAGKRMPEYVLNWEALEAYAAGTKPRHAPKRDDAFLEATRVATPDLGTLRRALKAIGHDLPGAVLRFHSPDAVHYGLRATRRAVEERQVPRPAAYFNGVMRNTDPLGHAAYRGHRQRAKGNLPPETYPLGQVNVTAIHPPSSGLPSSVPLPEQVLVQDCSRLGGTVPPLAGRNGHPTEEEDQALRERMRRVRVGDQPLN